MEKNEKPEYMSDKEWFVKQLSRRIEVDENVILKIINHQYESAIQATQKNKTIELSGFGVLAWNDNRAQKKVDDMDDMIMAYRGKIAEGHPESNSFIKIIDDILRKRQTLINRINELNSDLRGVEKPSAPRGRPKGSRNKNKRRANGNL